MRRVTVDQARRIALAAQGFTDPRPRRDPDRRHLRRVFRRVGLLQLDSVNVLARSHYLPVLARLGRYQPSRLDAYTTGSGEIFEYWSHVASLLPVEDYPLYRHAMETAKPWRQIVDIERAHPGYVESVYEEVARHGPLTVSDLEDPGRRHGPWWGYGKGKHALEWLYLKGRLAAYRGHGFVRVYDLAERLIDGDVLAAEPVPREEAHRRLLERAARAHGIGTAADLADYHRLGVPGSKRLLEGLADAGRLERVEVPGWRGPVYLHPEAVLPRRVEGCALLSPFDSLVWARERTERLFGFRYRVEIYVPAAQRVYGYYVLPVLLDGELVGRVDLKADRGRRSLLVRSAWLEDGRSPRHVAGALAGTLSEMAGWLGFGDIEVHDGGNLATVLGVAVA